MDKLAYSIDEATELLGIGRSLLYELIAQGKLGSVKAGGRRLISQKHSTSSSKVKSRLGLPLGPGFDGH